MPRRQTRTRAAILVLGLTGSLLSGGCGPADKSPARKSRDSKSSDSKPNGKQPAKRHPNTAADAVHAVLDGFHNKRPEAVWDFLPAGYQRDLTGLAARFGRQMDPDLWKRFFGILRRVIEICKARKSEILSSPAVSRLGTGNPRQLSVQWETTLGLAETLVNSDVSDLQRLKTIDLRAFLAATGGEFLRRLAIYSRHLPGDDDFKLELDPLADIAVREVSSNETTAVVELSLVGKGERPLRFSFVRVEEKWVPKKTAATWKANIAARRRELDEDLPRWLKANKAGVTANFARIETSLTELESAKEAGEFQKRFSASPVAEIVVWALRSGTRRGTQTPVTTIPKTGKKPPKTTGKTAVTVIVIVQANLDDETADKVADKLFDLGKNIDVGDCVRSNGTTRFPVSPVGNFGEFRKRIQFADVVSADAQKREIVIKLK
ncbi:MAG: hypothetical protein ACE5KM_16570 [Planctomycetaceae bacterium]